MYKFIPNDNHPKPEAMVTRKNSDDVRKNQTRILEGTHPYLGYTGSCDL